MFRYLVLGLLRDGQRRHGYAVMKAYRERSGLQVNTGSFYRQLQRLVAEGLIQTVANPADADPRRAPYEITETGEACFDAWLSGPTGAGVGRYEDELSSRAMFLADAEPDIVLRLLDSWKEELWLKSKVHERARSTLAPESYVPPKSFTPLPLLLARNMKHVTADIEFLEELSSAYTKWLDDFASLGQTRKRRVSSSPPGRRQRIDD
jgi:DNA-binding PadR family transcriptional regulator